ncbi:MAG: MBL fold metallo-hydrolase [Syntrophales bacterium]|nr:MBL fold metallo-hydrolase [Syntrophales bacterium]
MNIRLLGAARTVTGSCFEVEVGGHVFAVDCGMHQGGKEAEGRNREMALYAPHRWEFILLTHAHIDHSGLLPRVKRFGFDGPIYMTPPTQALVEIMLLDSAHIQEMEAQWKNVRLKRRGEAGEVEPLYTVEDVHRVLPLLKQVDYGQKFSPTPGLVVTYRDSGHILGSAFLEIEAEENGRPLRVVFSGDVGRPAQLIVRDPTPLEEADYLFLESTYGDRDHKNEKESLDELAEAIWYAFRKGEKVVIPAFAVERTQEIIYCLYLLFRENVIPADIPVFVDSPLAIQATDVFRRFKSYYDEDMMALVKRGEDPFRMPQLKYTLSTEESMAINSFVGTAIVISASGMADAGRIKHHLKHNLWREGASIVFVGYQAHGTVGRRIVDGAKTVRIFGDDVAVRAKVFTINGFSAHAGQRQLISWVKTLKNKPRHIFLVHGEYEAQKTLGALIEKELGYPVSIPDYGEKISITVERAPMWWKEIEEEVPTVDWMSELIEIDRRLAEIETSKTWLKSPEAKVRLEKLKERVERLLAG